MILVLGASGFIGRHVFRHLRDNGVEAVGTFCHREEPDLVQFDLARDDVDAVLDLYPISSVICVAESHKRLDDYRRFHAEAQAINVMGMQRFLQACFRRGIKPVYVSTDNVFDGTKGNYSEGDRRNPVTSYGRMRYEVENSILSASDPHVILRAGRVFGVETGDGTLLTELVARLSSGETVDCAVDQVFTPLFVNELSSFLLEACERELCGTYHIASSDPITMLDIAEKIKAFHQMSEARIRPCLMNSLGLLDKRPLKIDLNAAKYYQTTGEVPKAIEDYLQQIST